MIKLLFIFTLIINTLHANEYWLQVLTRSTDYLGALPEFQYRVNEYGENTTNLLRYNHLFFYESTNFVLGGAYFNHLNKIDEKRVHVGANYLFLNLNKRTYLEKRYFEGQQAMLRLRHRFSYIYHFEYLDIIPYQETFYQANAEGFNEFRYGLTLRKNFKSYILKITYSYFQLKDKEDKDVTMFTFVKGF